MPSLKQLPCDRELPSFMQMLEDLRVKRPEELAEAMDVHPKTVRRWLDSQAAPKPVLLALYWLTRWGSASRDAELFNRAQVYQGLAEAQGRELKALKARVAHLSRLGDFSSANDPAIGAIGPAPSDELRLTFAGFEDAISTQQVATRARVGRALSDHSTFTNFRGARRAAGR